MARKLGDDKTLIVFVIVVVIVIRKCDWVCLISDRISQIKIQQSTIGNRQSRNYSLQDYTDAPRLQYHSLLHSHPWIRNREHGFGEVTVKYGDYDHDNDHDHDG